MPAIEPEGLGLSPDRLLADLQVVMEGSYNPSHPGALAHLDPPPLVAGLAAELICAGLNNNLLAEELSPSLSRLERGLCGWLAGQIANSDGVVLCSEDAHLSLLKALTVMGMPPQALIRLPVDQEGAMEPMALEETLQLLARQGRPVIAVVATAGTTVRGAVDPLGPIANICQRFGHWLHVDGAIGAVFALADHPLTALEGLGQADSITVNPQKLLGIPKTSSLLLLADPSLLKATFATGLPYMEPSWGLGHGGEEGLQGTRAAEILKLWLGLRPQRATSGLGGCGRDFWRKGCCFPAPCIRAATTSKRSWAIPIPVPSTWSISRCSCCSSTLDQGGGRSATTVGSCARESLDGNAAQRCPFPLGGHCHRRPFDPDRRCLSAAGHLA